MDKKLAPIALFTYARPDHTRATVEALAANPLASRSVLHVFSDALRGDLDAPAVERVREYLREIKGFAAVHITERERHFGLADSIVDGVTRIINEYGRIIVLEDDLVVSPFFLRYMNDALELYKDEERVMHVAGFTPAMDVANLPESFFSRAMMCWGWGTWDRAWRHFNRDAEDIAASFTPDDIARFNLDGAYDFWRQIQLNRSGIIKTWAVFWYASIFRRNGLCLSPRASLTANIGHDGTGENCGVDKHFSKLVSPLRVREFPFLPKDLHEHPEALRRLRDFWLSRSVGSQDLASFLFRHPAALLRILSVTFRRRGPSRHAGAKHA